MLCDVDQVTAVRFILRQPSPVWLHFTIEELQIFPPGQKVSACQCCPPCPVQLQGLQAPSGGCRDVGPSPCPLLGAGGELLQPAPALPVLEVGVCLSSRT